MRDTLLFGIELGGTLPELAPIWIVSQDVVYEGAVLVG